MKTDLLTMRYVGPIRVRILGLGEFEPGKTYHLPEAVAKELATDPNWELVQQQEKKTKRGE